VENHCDAARERDLGASCAATGPPPASLGLQGNERATRAASSSATPGSGIAGLGDGAAPVGLTVLIAARVMPSTDPRPYLAKRAGSFPNGAATS
jgi:hypothetical protein